MLFAGIDVGSRALKGVLIKSGNGEIAARAVIDQHHNQKKIIDRLLRKLLACGDIKRKDVARIVATGYGRNLVTFADQIITEITCQAAGVRRLMPDARTIIDIGGQDTKVIFLDGTGRVRDFVTNDRCAAGTGRFLELLAERLSVSLKTLGNLAGKSRRPAAINSTCAVFAETEIVGLLAAGVNKNDIAAGVQKSIAGRICTMVARNIDLPLCFTGGVALVALMSATLASALGHEVVVAPHPQFTCALGAALLAKQQFNQGVSQ
jgi:predicted CoA-substrate-specific enzyme activase